MPLPYEHTPDKEYQFIRSERVEPAKGNKMPSFLIINKRAGDIIGAIAYQPGWRQFVFLPADNTEWSTGCLRDVLDVMDRAKL